MPNSLAPELTLWPLLNALRTSTAVQLGAFQRPVCEFHIYAAGHPMPADKCDCTCESPDGTTGQGSAWVRFVSATTTTNLQGQQYVPRACGGGELMITVEVGVYRCAPTLNPPDAEPDPQAIAEYAEGQAKDVVALHRAFHCNQWLADNDSDWQITSIVNNGPEGGCGSTTATAQVMRTDCCPVSLAMIWTPVPGQLLTVSVTLGGFGNNSAWLDWGDGTSFVQVARNTPVEHAYFAPGTYVVTAVDADERDVVATSSVSVKDHLPKAAITGHPAQALTAVLTLDEPPDTTTYFIDWGDGTPLQQITGEQVQKPTTHAYSRQGPWPVTVTDSSTRRSVTIPYPTEDSP
jgi:hypothetical protein